MTEEIKKNLDENNEIKSIPYLDKTKTLEERKILYKEAINKKINPIPSKDFNPLNFEPIGTPEEKEVAYRKRIKPDKNLPTLDLLPKELMVGQMIGEYESKGNLYLIFAHRCNDLQIEINELKEEIKNLKDKK